MKKSFKCVTQNRNLDIKLAASQKGLCAKCRCDLSKVDEAHIDHVIPVSKGRSEDESNKQLMRRACNLQKGARIEGSLLTNPKKPVSNETWDAKRDSFILQYVERHIAGHTPDKVTAPWEAEAQKRGHAIHFDRHDWAEMETWF